MITASVTVTVDHAKLRSQVGREAVKFIDRVTAGLQLRSRELAPSASGRLRQSIRTEDARLVSPTRATGRVLAHAPYAIYQHEGTGIYGPYRRRIRPKRAKALRFFWRKAGGIVFFKSVKGAKPAATSKFMVRAVEEVLSSPPWKIVYFTSLR